MRGTFRVDIIAAAASCCAIASANAAKRPAPSSNLTAIQFECFKQYGALIDPETKRWVIKGTDLDMVSKQEAIYSCVAQKTGKRPAPFLRERRVYRCC